MLRPTNKIQNIDISTLEVYWDMSLLDSFWMGDQKIKAIGTASSGDIIIEKNINSILLNKSDFILCVGSDTFPSSDSVTEDNFQNYIRDAGDSQMLPKSSETMWFRINYCETNTNNDTPFTIVISGTKLQLTAISGVNYAINRDTSDGIIVIGLKKKFVLIYNIKPPYIINKVVNIYHISPQTKGGDNMLRRSQNQTINFLRSQVIDLRTSDVGKIILKEDPILIKYEANIPAIFPPPSITPRPENVFVYDNIYASNIFILSRVGRNNINLQFGLCIRYISDNVFANPYAASAFDAELSVYINLLHLFGNANFNTSLGIKTYKFTHVQGYCTLSISTRHEDMPDTSFGIVNLYGNQSNGIKFHNGERKVTLLKDKSLVSIDWSNRVDQTGLFISINGEVNLVGSDDMFTRESLDWFDMTEKKT